MRVQSIVGCLDEAGLLLAELGGSHEAGLLLAKLVGCVLWRCGSEGGFVARRWEAARPSRAKARWGAAGGGSTVMLVVAAVVKWPLEAASEADDLICELVSVRRSVGQAVLSRRFSCGCPPPAHAYTRQPW